MRNEDGRAGTGLREHRIGVAMQMLDEGVEKILDSESFKRYLAFAARFHVYSANNCMLILLQKPSATRVAGYGNWRGLGRQVKRDERGIDILAPVFRTVEDEETGEKIRAICAFKVVRVFDISQTIALPGAEPLPEKPHPETLSGSSSTAAHLIVALKKMCRDEGLEVRESDDEINARYPTANALYSPVKKLILLKETLSGDQKTKSLLHEYVHHVMHRDAIRTGVERPLIEAEAEGAAYAVLSYFGLDTSGYSFAYVAHWTEDKEVVRLALVKIQGTVGRIIRNLESMAGARIAAESLET
ncbi:ArdC family protein [Rubrobacter indicoceani]|uniref:ArdC family protein n=1 Tax=Rubrobacter indicoceani TaxID=2051957 RepID=UPI000E5A729F|nr:ArdC family protein [Rubrobacter indicoceani]